MGGKPRKVKLLEYRHSGPCARPPHIATTTCSLFGPVVLTHTGKPQVAEICMFEAHVIPYSLIAGLILLWPHGRGGQQSLGILSRRGHFAKDISAKVRRCAPKIFVTLVILPYFTLIGLVKALTELINVKYSVVTSFANNFGAQLRTSGKVILAATLCVIDKKSTT